MAAQADASAGVEMKQVADEQEPPIPGLKESDIPSSPPASPADKSVTPEDDGAAELAAQNRLESVTPNDGGVVDHSSPAVVHHPFCPQSMVEPSVRPHAPRNL